MKRATVAASIVVALLCSVAAQSHHSFAAMYRSDQMIQIEGQIVQFLFRNPHSFVHVMAPDDDGEMARWTVEWSGASALDTGGLQPDTLKRGDTVVISGTPGRNPEDHRIRLITLERPSDGFSWGNRPGETVD